MFLPYTAELEMGIETINMCNMNIQYVWHIKRKKKLIDREIIDAKHSVNQK